MIVGDEEGRKGIEYQTLVRMMEPWREVCEG